MQAVERARVELETLRMRPPEVDTYIAKFQNLCHKAGYTAGSTEVIYLFLKGLPKPVLEDVVKGPQTTNFEELKERTIQVTRSQELLNNILKQQSHGNQSTPQPQFQPRGFQGGAFRGFQRFNMTFQNQRTNQNNF